MAKTKTAPKQKQEMKTSNYIGLLIVISILVILIGGLVAKNLSSKFLLNQKIVSKKNTAQQVLAADVQSAKNITQQYQALGAQAQSINDALPPDADIPGLANIVEAMAGISGVQYSTVASSASSTVVAAAPAVASTTSSSSATPVAVPISITATSSYANLTRFLTALESSSRPIHVTDIQLSGTSASLNVTINAITYYQAPVAFSVTKEVVK
jgi:Tfp pilus assembly protein PilO